MTFWFDVYLDDQIFLSSSPAISKTTGWKQALQYLDKEFSVMPGERLLVSVSHDCSWISFKINERKIGHGRFSNLKPLVLHWHFPMIYNNERNIKYREAINRAIRKNENPDILDIGTGTGLLSMMAAWSGAKSVTACEMIQHIANTAHNIINVNGFGNQINLLP